jgi:hypothetical protein
MPTFVADVRPDGAPGSLDGDLRRVSITMRWMKASSIGRAVTYRRK